MLFQLAFTGLIGLALLRVGWLIWKRQRIDLIHEHHTHRVSAEDRPAFTAGMGRALMLIGAGCLLCGLINWLSGTWWGWAAFVTAFIAGCARMLRLGSRCSRRPSGRGA